MHPTISEESPFKTVGAEEENRLHPENDRFDISAQVLAMTLQHHRHHIKDGDGAAVPVLRPGGMPLRGRTWPRFPRNESCPCSR